MIRDELMLDGSARLNLATFVTTWMEPQAEALMAECSDKNMIDKDEYAQTAELERRCGTSPGARGLDQHVRAQVRARLPRRVSRRLRERGWLVPAYSFPERRTDLDVLRVVVRAATST